MTNPVIEAIRARRSIRFYEDRQVPDEMIKELVELGQLAPNGMGLQSWHFTVVKNRALLTEISESQKEIMLASGIPDAVEKASAPDFDSFRHAPMAIILSGETASRFHTADCANAVTTMALAAQSMGLATCYLAGFTKGFQGPKGKELTDRLNLPDGFIPEFALAVGFKAEEPHERKPRRTDAVNYVD